LFFMSTEIYIYTLDEIFAHHNFLQHTYNFKNHSPSTLLMMMTLGLFFNFGTPCIARYYSLI
jgi:hypothetical protein